MNKNHWNKGNSASTPLEVASVLRIISNQQEK